MHASIRTQVEVGRERESGVGSKVRGIRGMRKANGSSWDPALDNVPHRPSKASDFQSSLFICNSCAAPDTMGGKGFAVSVQTGSKQVTDVLTDTEKKAMSPFLL